MFPYASNEYNIWNGYYTSRPNLKEYIRRISTATHSFFDQVALEMLGHNDYDMYKIESVIE